MGHWHYFLHLTLWVVPIIAGQWFVGARTFRRNLRAIVLPALAGTLFFSACDSVAVRSGLWSFDPAQCLGWNVGPLPFEEVLFFFLTSWLVAQSLLLLLPAENRR